MGAYKTPELLRNLCMSRFENRKTIWTCDTVTLMASLARHLSNDNFCNRPWPSLQLFLPLSLSYSKKDLRYYEFETLFLRSFVLFWPLQISNTSLKVVVNSESVTSTSYVELLGTISGYQSIVSGGISISQSNPSEYYKR